MALAARGTRNLDAGEEKIEDPALRTQLQRQAWRVYGKSIAVGVLMTVICLLI